MLLGPHSKAQGYKSLFYSRADALVLNPNTLHWERATDLRELRRNGQPSIVSL